MSDGELHSLSAFAEAAGGGNPAGVWIGDAFPDSDEMQRIAADVGFSETAFVTPRTGTRRTVRYFRPKAEVTFCGHATIAAGGVLGTDAAATTYEFETLAGRVPVEVSSDDGRVRAALTSVDTRHRCPDGAVIEQFLAALGWRAADLDTGIRPAFAFAGAWHLVLAAADQARLRELSYDFDGLARLMTDHDLTTLQLVWREHETLFHARNPFPVGGVVEDPATGAAAAALGGYLRDAGYVAAPISFRILQGQAMGQPSTLYVDVPDAGGVVVSGFVVDIDGA